MCGGGELLLLLLVGFAAVMQEDRSASQGHEVGSAALVPLGERADIGFLAIGSADADRFHPGMSIDFLGRIGELVAGALKRY